jgi:hypothetical protein
MVWIIFASNLHSHSFFKDMVCNSLNPMDMGANTDIVHTDIRWILFIRISDGYDIRYSMLLSGGYGLSDLFY